VGFLESEDRRALLGELIRVRQALHGEAGLERCVADLLAAWTMGSAARRAGLTAGDLEDVRAGLLGTGAGFLVYVPTGPVTHALAIEAGRITAHELKDQSGAGIASIDDSHVPSFVCHALFASSRPPLNRVIFLRSSIVWIRSSIDPDPGFPGGLGPRVPH
jgi:hypothetical protein